MLGRFIGMRYRVMMQDMLEVNSLEELYSMIISIVKYTFFIEHGEQLFWLWFHYGWLGSLRNYYGIFHSVSAFCNAGFSLFNNSESYAPNLLFM